MKFDGIEINKENFPDKMFRAHVFARDTNLNGYLDPEEVEATTDLTISGVTIDDIKGLEHFTNLETLKITYAKLTKIDLSSNTKLKSLIVSNNSLSEIDVSMLNNLETLDVSFNSLSNLDLSNNNRLKWLNCSSNNIWGTLSLEKNMFLKTVAFSSNPIREVKFYCPFLQNLYCGLTNIKEIDFSQFPSLTILDASFSYLDSIDLSQNINLEQLDLTGQLSKDLDVSAIDLSNCTNLKAFYSGYNVMDSMILPKDSLIKLVLNYNILEELDLSDQSKLQYLDCSNNKLTSIKLPKNSLVTLNVSNNELTKLDLSEQSNLQHLKCAYNNLSSLNISSKNISKEFNIIFFKNFTL